MYTLSNDELTVEILDPVTDRERMGVRYCTGGYIYQVHDVRLGPLMSGPTYPDSFNWFDGQGIPDAFNLQPLQMPDATDAEALIIGIGVCDLAEKTVKTFCDWIVEESSNALRMATRHAYGPYTLALVRTVTLEGRSIRSEIQLRNTGPMPVRMRWFPHPFYPQPQTDELCRLNIPVQLPESEAYELAENGFIRRKGWPWQGGHYLALDQTAMTNLVIGQRHPTLGLVSATCSYVPDYFPIWGNPQTFSWEPFLERTVGNGQTLNWWIDYDF